MLKNGTTNALPATTTLTLGEATGNTGGTFDLNGFDQTITGLTGAGSGTRLVTNRAASGTNTLGVTGASAFSGAIQNGPTATTALTKSGTGTFTLSGLSSYTGPTIVSGGTLAISGSLSGTTALSLTGGTLLLGASDMLNNAASLTLAGGTFSTNGFSEGTATVPGLDILHVTAASTIDFGAGASVLHFASATSPSGTLALTNWDAGLDRLIFSGDAVARAAFETAFAPTSISFNGGAGYTAVQFDAGHFEIVAVPEPSSVALLAAASLLRLGDRRRVRRRLSPRV